MIIAFVIWTMVAFLFVLIGISAWKSEQEVGFFTFLKPAKMKDIKKYNQAVGKLWFLFAAILEALGMPILYAEQNSPVFIFVILGVLTLVIAMMIIYFRIEKRYRER